MLAVKHIQLSGHEEIYLTNRVSFEPAFTPDNTAGLKPRPCIWVQSQDGATHNIDGGTVFVMNDLGKTISRYDLGASMVPLEMKLADAA